MRGKPKMSEKPGGVLLYDSLDRPNADKKSDVQSRSYTKIDYKIALVGILFFIVLFIILVVIHQFAWGLYESYEYRNLGILLLAPMYLSFGAIIIGLVTIILKWLYILATKSGLVNVMEHQTNIRTLSNNPVATQYFDVMGRRADKSTFSSAQNITYSPHHSTSNTNNAPVEDDTSTELAIDTDIPVPTLHAMKDKGLIGRSGNSLLVGFGEDQSDI